jgi:hypothetical protein
MQESNLLVGAVIAYLAISRHLPAPVRHYTNPEYHPAIIEL